MALVVYTLLQLIVYVLCFEEVLVETDRLKIKLLTIEELTLYVRADGSLQRRLQLNYQGIDLPVAVRKLFEKVVLPKVLGNPQLATYYNPWILILKERNVIVGELLFKGPPNSEGEIEIGYGIMEGFQNNGLMTEALQRMLQWAEEKTDVRSIVAETFPDNTASLRVLEKSIFQQHKETDGSLWWKYQFDRT